MPTYKTLGAIAVSAIMMLAFTVQSNHVMKRSLYIPTSRNATTAFTLDNMSYSRFPQEPSLGPHTTSEPVCTKFEPAKNDSGLSTEEPKPGGSQGDQKVDEIKVKPPVMAKFGKILDATPPNCVFIANTDGDILNSFRLHDATLEKYSSFEQYVGTLSSEPAKKPCKRISDACVLCPDRKVYCTNAAKYSRRKLNSY